MAFIRVRTREYNLSLLAKWEMVGEDKDGGQVEGFYRLHFLGEEKPLDLSPSETQAFGLLIETGVVAVHDLTNPYHSWPLGSGKPRPAFGQGGGSEA